MALSALSPRQRHCLSQMGIAIWVPRTPPPARRPAPGAPPPEPRSWQALQEQVRGCRLCPLHRSRTQTVFGVGNPRAEWLLVGEAPGAEEDRKGEPFVGRAGKLLDAMLQAMGLKRQEVFITNILKCRPPANRNPQPEEMSACADYLRRQIAWVRPRIILALGRVAAGQLLGVGTPLGALRGQTHRYREDGLDIPLIVTWHPAYLLRQPAAKAGAWRDLQQAMKLLRDRP